MTERHPAVLLMVCACVGCTRPTPTPFPERSGAVQTEEKRELTPFLVHDVRKRWVASFLARQLPQRDEQPGYVQIRSDIGTGRDLQCFVYDNDLDPGQAVTRFFRAASTGITFEDISLTSLEVHDGEALLFFAAPYREETAESSGRGSIKFALSPRFEFPFVCVHDQLGHRQLFESVVRQLARGFSLSATTERSLGEVEIWEVRQADELLGVELVRRWDAEDKHHLFYLVSQFAFVRKKLETRDRARYEKSDESGVLQQVVVDLEGTERTLSIVLDRNDERQESDSPEVGGAPARYRFQGHVGPTPVRGEFKAPRGLDDFRSREAWMRTSPPSARVEMHLYEPRSSVSEPRGSFLQKDANWVERLLPDGTIGSRIELGGDGRPRLVEIPDASPPIVSRLRYRGFRSSQHDEP